VLPGILEALLVIWPSGLIEKSQNVQANQILTITEGKGTKRWNP
jgi:hypothetical protein